jgi:hypothetical protein
MHTRDFFAPTYIFHLRYLRRKDSTGCRNSLRVRSRPHLTSGPPALDVMNLKEQRRGENSFGWLRPPQTRRGIFSEGIHMHAPCSRILLRSLNVAVEVPPVFCLSSLIFNGGKNDITEGSGPA